MSEQVQIQRVFDNVQAHQRIADLIQRYSTNKRGVHQTALEGLDLTACRSVLDLGCAFGSFTEKLKGRVGPAAEATGVDAVPAYEPLYLAACERTGMRGRFFSSGSSVLNSFAGRSRDLILCSYVLYFFPEAIPEIARLLRDDGIFIPITHHRRNAVELIGLTKKHSMPSGSVIKSACRWKSSPAGSGQRTDCRCCSPGSAGFVESISRTGWRSRKRKSNL